MDLYDVGLYGLDGLGQNFALNMASNGFKVCVGSDDSAEVDTTVQRANDEGELPLAGAYSIEEFVSKLSKPRKVVLTLSRTASEKPIVDVDDTIASLSEHMEEGDVIVDGSENEWYTNSVRRAETLEKKGILFLAMGIAGGKEGARHGPSLMPGGSRRAFEIMENIFAKCSAQVEDAPCMTYIGPIGSGNYVKMIHDGIEYADMQLIAEAYDILRKIIQMPNEEMASKFAEWNEGILESYLMEITAKILVKPDDVTGEGYVLDYIMDKTAMKGTEKWTMQEAAEQSVTAPSIASALDVRYISTRKDERVEASKRLQGPCDISYCPKEQLMEDLVSAMYSSKLCSYAQGLSLIKCTSDKNKWKVNLSEITRIWKGGSILRAKILDKIQSALGGNIKLANLMMDQTFADELRRKQFAWRRVVTLCVAYGFPCPGFCASLNYYDMYRSEKLPTNLLQAQRDFSGGHSFERIDREGQFHCVWTESHRAIEDAPELATGEV